MYIFLYFLLFFNSLIPQSSSQDRYFKSGPDPSPLPLQGSRQYLEITPPLPSDHLNPLCTRSLLNHDFANTVGSPPISVPYSPPSDCPLLRKWNRVILELTVSSRGQQYDRIAGLWLDGAELLRTSTAEPNSNGVFWKVRKDITRYTSLLTKSNVNFTMMLENAVDNVFTGIYHVNVSLFYYKMDGVRVPSEGKLGFRKLGRLGKSGGKIRALYETPDRELGIEELEKMEILRKLGGNTRSLYETPADLIIPINNNVTEKGYWFKIQSETDLRSKSIRIPRHTLRAVLELYVSFHGDDEYWYSNPPNAYIKTNNLTTSRGNGAFREVYLSIDGNFVGSEIMIPVIFTGGINPLSWDPVVAIGAFDLPTYDFDLSPFLGNLMDGKDHTFTIGVSDSIPYWLVDANLHLWLDRRPYALKARTVVREAADLKLQRSSKFKKLDGLFKVKAERRSRFAGWVISSVGNLSTTVLQEFKFKNFITFRYGGTHKMVKQKVKSTTEVWVEDTRGEVLSHVYMKRKYPLAVAVTNHSTWWNDGTFLLHTNVSHSLKQNITFGVFSNVVHNNQDSWGWMKVRGSAVLSGQAKTNQTFDYQDDFGCYIRNVASVTGRILNDYASNTCAPPE